MEEIKDFIEENEKILWSGAPDRNARTENFYTNLYNLIYGIIGLIYVMFMMLFFYYYVIWPSNTDISFVLIIIFIFIALALMLLLIIMYEYKRSFYEDIDFLITNGRVFIVCPKLSNRTNLTFKLYDNITLSKNMIDNLIGYIEGSKINIIYVRNKIIEEIQISSSHQGYNIEFFGDFGNIKFSIIIFGLDDLIKIIENNFCFKKILDDRKKISYKRVEIMD